MELKLARFKSQNLGYTIIELLVASTISLLVVSAALSLFYYCSQSFAFLFNHTTMQQENRYAIDKLTQELRGARCLTAYLKDFKVDDNTIGI